MNILENSSPPSDNKEADYAWKVWYSGALMTLWQILARKNLHEEARSVEQKIEQILLDERLAHRRRQWGDKKQFW